MDEDNKAASSRRRRSPAGADDPNDAISRKLQALYSSVEEEEIPDRLLDLLEKLEKAEQAAAAGGNGTAPAQ